MLEQKIKSWKNKLVVGVAGLGFIAGAYGCGPSASIPIINADTSGNKAVPNSGGKSCCEILSCDSKDWDYCTDDGIKSVDGVLYDTCSCHDLRYGKKSSESDSSSRDNNNYQNDFGRKNHSFRNCRWVCDGKVCRRVCR